MKLHLRIIKYIVGIPRQISMFLSGEAAERDNRRRGIRKLLSLAEEQAEEHGRKLALRWVKQLVRKINRQNRRNDRDSRPRGRGGKVPEHRDARKLLEVKISEKSRDDMRNIIDAVAYKIRFALKRYHLRVRPVCRWEMRCSRLEFMGLFMGFLPIHEHQRTKKLWAVIEKPTADESMSELAKILNFAPSERNWFSRRWCGSPDEKRRDCAFIHINPKHEMKKKIIFGWKMKSVRDIDHKGLEHENHMGIMFCTFPRGVTVWNRPKKKQFKVRIYVIISNAHVCVDIGEAQGLQIRRNRPFLSAVSLPWGFRRHFYVSLIMYCMYVEVVRPISLSGTVVHDMSPRSGKIVIF